MVLSSLLSSFRSQAAMQAEILALRHQLIVVQRTQKTKRPRGSVVLGLALTPVGRLAFRSSHLSNLQPSSAGTVKDSTGIGLGRFVMAEKSRLSMIFTKRQKDRNAVTKLSVQPGPKILSRLN
jgi:hypothetical protein